MQQKTIFWVIATLLAITPAFPRPSSAQTAADRIRAALTRQPVYNVVDSERRMSERQFYQLNHIAEGNSSKAMHKRFGLPHGSIGRTEYYPYDRPGENVWIGINYNQQGQYIGYGFSKPIQYNQTQAPRFAYRRTRDGWTMTQRRWAIPAAQR